ncbi:pentatricopeptide repeat-containing protein At2g03880, mitochondrial-like [Cryptomeria japonica]|uniref:pentatricopeptide repeat-containing protein At2g03880, mitochondrial-like n=1 Tax=Cryptomeria japonica TaxID=3369 RepID=UPI0027DA0D74|nr:pentatricopeptide repeat-containing protein At2g03880, mitochondrial-like [Cryptomeria japonica]
MYAKCGNIEDARSIFDKMPHRGVVLWNAMIMGYAMHGFDMEALKIFNQMEQSGIDPDHITFVGVLPACCHAGLVDKGWHYFKCMRDYYQITPTMRIYGCMVDLLGRAGNLAEAKRFTNEMPIIPDASIRKSFLGACRIHADVGLGELVAEHLFQLDSEDLASYVLLSNDSSMAY